MKIKTWKIVSGFEDDITPEINRLIGIGWQPYGAPSRDWYGCYYQVMVLVEDSPQTIPTEYLGNTSYSNISGSYPP